VSADRPIEPQEFAEAFRRVSEWAMVEAQQGRSPFKATLTEHFGEDPVTYPLTGEAMRKAALHAARSGSPRVEDAHFREALDLLERGGRVTRAMLGADSGAVEQ
jgi:hypothetical protein